MLFICLLSSSAMLLKAQEKTIPSINTVGSKAMPSCITPYEKNPFNMPQLYYPVFPENSVNIRDKGAMENKPITVLVNQLISVISKKGGGKLIIPKGKWVSGRIVLKSNVNLYLEAGSEIEFSDNPTDYLPSVFTTHEGIEIMGAGAFIYACGENNIAITGKGHIYGPAMDTPMRKISNSVALIENRFPKKIGERIFDGMEGRHFFAPKVISPINCNNVLIEGITIERCLFWNINPTYCENVIIRGVTVNSKGIPSGDGIDITCCKNVLVEYCTMNCGDDCYALKGGRNGDGMRVGRPTENVIIRHCLAMDGHGGITTGSETAGGIRNVYSNGCMFDGTQIGIRFKTRRPRSGVTEKLYYENFKMTNVRDAFTWDLLGSKQFMGELADRLPLRPITELTPEVKDIHIKDFVIESAKRLIMANGIPELPFNHVVIESGTINTKELIPVMNDFINFTMRNLSIKTDHNVINIIDGQNLLLDNIGFIIPKNKLYINVQGEKVKNIKVRNIQPDIEIKVKKDNNM
ncbi:polygalacturonase [Bacteroides reticulotermitis JCM 10512]|uniref:Polygalacturonase n=2 Tax=Bacteroides reticulotermitis TaxID=1133319 RepID=W4UWH9_9BACE|nr:polygalacturonase [Bacteroides reticulotermitis JCM 10512]